MPTIAEINAKIRRLEKKRQQIRLRLKNDPRCIEAIQNMRDVYSHVEKELGMDKMNAQLEKVYDEAFKTRYKHALAKSEPKVK